jgi:hypothetical protein
MALTGLFEWWRNLRDPAANCGFAREADTLLKELQMRVVVRKESLRRTWRVLFFGGLSLLVYRGFVLVDAREFQERERRLLDRLLIEKRTPSLEIRASASGLSAKIRVAVARGGLIGRMEIPRLDLSAIIIEGSDPATSRRAAGHIRARSCRAQLAIQRLQRTGIRSSGRYGISNRMMSSGSRLYRTRISTV